MTYLAGSISQPQGSTVGQAFSAFTPISPGTPVGRMSPLACVSTPHNLRHICLGSRFSQFSTGLRQAGRGRRIGPLPSAIAASSAGASRSVLAMGVLGDIKGNFKGGFKGGFKGVNAERLGCDAPPELVQERIDCLNELRQLPIRERFERLNAKASDDRQVLLESGATGDAVVSRLIADYDWENFRLDTLGTAGVYPYALLCKLVYQSDNCQGGQAPCFEAAFTKLMDAGYTIASVHDKIVEGSKVSNRALVISKWDRAVIVARGTQSARDLITNINAFSYPRERDLQGYCHRGYYYVTEKIWSNLEAHLDELQQKVGGPIQVGVVGHSMGSPIATLISEHIEQKPGFSISKVVTVGGVKAYDQEACEQYSELGLDKKTIRIINYADSITLLWPHFQHPGSNSLFFAKKGQYWFNPTMKDRLVNQLQRLQGDDDIDDDDRERRSLTDHDLDEYIKVLHVHSLDQFGPEELNDITKDST